MCLVFNLVIRSFSMSDIGPLQTFVRLVDLMKQIL